MVENGGLLMRACADIATCLRRALFDTRRAPRVRCVAGTRTRGALLPLVDKMF